MGVLAGGGVGGEAAAAPGGVGRRAALGGVHCGLAWLGIARSCSSAAVV